MVRSSTERFADAAPEPLDATTALYRGSAAGDLYDDRSRWSSAIKARSSVDLRSRPSALDRCCGPEAYAGSPNLAQVAPAFKRAETLSPQQFRTNVFAREAVGDLLGRSLGEDARREVRGMAWRMGIAA